MTKKTEYKRFTALVDELMMVPHSEVKTKLDAEKEAKKTKKLKKKKEGRL